MEVVDTTDLNSVGQYCPYRFESGLSYLQVNQKGIYLSVQFKFTLLWTSKPFYLTTSQNL